jgi:serine/threonine protein phosphatase 1
MGKIFAIGDIHGCPSKLNEMMAKLRIDAEEDTVIFIGDYIDRGPDSKGVIDSILEIRQRIDNVICLQGNHEEMFLKYYCEHEDEDLFMHNGCMMTLLSYGYTGRDHGYEVNVPEEHLQFFSSLLSFYETDSYIFVHAGLRPGIPLKRQIKEDMLWIRREFIISRYDFGKTVIFGHTPVSHDMPYIKPNKIGIDTGLVYGGRLTCLELPGMIIHQV